MECVGLLKACLGIGLTEVAALRVLREKRVATIDEVAAALGIAYANAAKSLARLAQVGLVEVTTLHDGKKGRPRKLYKLPEDARERIVRMLNECLRECIDKLVTG